ncbi:MAG: divergent polysaccharide deacetylase family protein [Gammaproteobacteria bacterium]|nr:divergent polysaccharide deacetylase family protein [Gammaproteobacteria bacterium]
MLKRLTLLFFVFTGSPCTAGSLDTPIIIEPVISIIIDDMGNQYETGYRAVTLPGAVACAFLPHVAFTHKLAVIAHSYNKEVILHAPMQANGNNRLGPGGLTVDMSQEVFLKTLREDIASVPHVTGISNHMGSLLTRHPDHMVWLMHEMNRHGNMFFVDSKTTAKSVASRVAGDLGIPNVERDVFLDNIPENAAIEKQFKRLVKIAKLKGSAIAVGHAYAPTLAYLEKELLKLDEHGVKLIPLAQMIEQRKRSQLPWQASLSPSLKAVKSSKQ